MIDYRVYLVTDDPSRYRGNWLDNVVAAVEGGVTCVQYRDTESDVDERYRRVLALQDALRGHREVGLIVNNEVELAKAVRADGVHVGQGDMDASLAAELLKDVRGFNTGAPVEIGLSITEIGQLEAVPSSVACLGIGPVFDARKTKADAAAAMGCEGLRQITAEIRRLGTVPRKPGTVPVAIGGITLANAVEVLTAGARGLAIVSAFSKAEDPGVVAKEFRKLVEKE